MSNKIRDSQAPDLDAAIAAVAERVSRSVAEVRTRGHGGGAGIVWRPDGLIVTNHHVAPGDGADVTLADGRSLSGPVIARDPQNDLAIIQVNGLALPAAPIGDARALRAGELVLAVGHPFGIRAAVTVGVVSTALEAPGARTGRSLIQADILLGPGNSGGPLTDARGRVVGINAMVNGRLALAVPGHLAERLIDGHAAPVLGIQAQEVELPPSLVATARAVAPRAVLVLGVTEGGRADRAGVLMGDIITAIEGQPVTETSGLQAALATHAGPTLRLALLRGGVPVEAIVRTAESDQRAA
ncbi:MAG TPA: trypsin-like peptidase domain-containing protein [Dehalococcoidia bacterium]|nr:trypsin-like peptidase domain-containing protein [Dehalococcoidia bacterium]